MYYSQHDNQNEGYPWNWSIPSTTYAGTKPVYLAHMKSKLKDIRETVFLSIISYTCTQSMYLANMICKWRISMKLVYPLNILNLYKVDVSSQHESKMKDICETVFSP